MKRLARIIAIIGGIVAIIWAMRDRLVSVAISREPEPPAFRVHEPPPSLETEATRPTGGRTTPEPVVAAAPESDTSDEVAGDVRTVKGIGPVFAGRLAAAGIADVAQLAATRPEQVAAVAGVALSRAAGWVEAARRMR